MIHNKTILGIIPARGGSKGVRNKNVRAFLGKTLVEWAIISSQNVRAIDEVIVSTDSNEIAKLAKEAGASVPFIRPKSIAEDGSSMLDVLEHAWSNHLDCNGKPYDFIVLLQPTSPLRNSDHITKAIKTYFDLMSSDQDSLVSVFPISSKYGWIMEVDQSLTNLTFAVSRSIDKLQRQSLSQYFLPNGAIYILKGSTIRMGLYRKNTIPFIMDADVSIDIDTEEEFNSAEQKMKRILL